MLFHVSRSSSGGTDGAKLDDLLIIVVKVTESDVVGPLVASPLPLDTDVVHAIDECVDCLFQRFDLLAFHAAAGVGQQ